MSWFKKKKENSQEGVLRAPVIPLQNRSIEGEIASQTFANSEPSFEVDSELLPEVDVHPLSESPSEENCIFESDEFSNCDLKEACTTVQDVKCVAKEETRSVEQPLPSVQAAPWDTRCFEPQHLSSNLQTGESTLWALEEKVKSFDRKKIRIIRKRLYNWVKTLCFLLVLAWIVHSFFLQRVVIQGDSMNPTYQNKTQVLVLKSFYRVKRGDVLVLNSKHLGPSVQAADLIQRVIAVGGDEVEIKNQKIYVNGKEVEEYYLPQNTQTDAIDLRYSHVRLDPNQLYMLGDNRDKSLDSRFFGPILRSDVEGEVLATLWNP